MENLKVTVLDDLKTAMKEKNTVKLEAVRAVKSAIDKFEKESLQPGNSMSSANYAKALSPLVKQRIDSIEQYRNAGNEELASKEEQELNVIKVYLSQVQPKQLSADEIDVKLEEFITGLPSGKLEKSDMGKVMSWFKSNFDGQYDGKELSNIVNKKINS